VMFGMYDFQGAYKTAPVDGRLLVTLAAFGVVLGAWYTLTLVMRIFFGPLKEPRHAGEHADVPETGEHALEPVRDLNSRELFALAPIAALCLFIGMFPQPLFDSIQPDVGVVARIARGARLRADAGSRGGAAAQPVAAAAPNVFGDRTHRE
jgi:NADH-quinone oxidoreductase subunit M